MAVASNVKEEYTFFWKDESPFSQWYPAQFTVDNIEYNCAEQFMMHQKAVLFKDDETANEILETKKPRKQKALGRNVQNFDEQIWTEKCRDIVKEGNRAKFSQNEDLKKILLDTEKTLLVEASPHDKIWGIGLSQDNPKANIKREWRGKNWLGYCLTQVRDEMLKPT